MKLNQRVSEPEKRTEVIGCRYTATEKQRFEKIREQLALPLEVKLSAVVQMLTLTGAAVFERKQLKGKKHAVR